MLRLYAINIFCFGYTGFILGTIMDKAITNWEFWVILLLMGVVQINNAIYPSQ